MHSSLAQATHTVTFYITPKEKQTIHDCLKKPLTLAGRDYIDKLIIKMKNDYVEGLDWVSEYEL